MLTPENLYRDVLNGKISINEGMLAENIVAQQFASSGHKLYYYSHNDPETNRSRIEIDFLIARPYDNAAGRFRVSPVEVKSSGRYRTASLDEFKEKFGSRVGNEYVLHPKQMVRERETESVFRCIWQDCCERAPRALRRQCKRRMPA